MIKRLFARRWQPDVRDSLSSRGQYLLSIGVTAAIALLLEYGSPVLVGAYYFPNDYGAWVAVLAWALVVGPMLVALKKSSIWVPFGIVAGFFVVIDLANHYWPVNWRFVEGAWEVASVDPRFYEWTDHQFLGLTHPLLIAVVSSLFQGGIAVLAVFFQRLVLITRKPPEVDDPKRLEPIFSDAVTPRGAMKPKRGFGFTVMIVIAAAYGAYFSYLVLALIVDGRDLPGVEMFFINPAETINSLTKLTLMFTLALVGAFNANIRREASLLLIVGHTASVLVSLGFFLGLEVNPLFPQDHEFLLATVIADGAIVAFLFYPLLKRRRESEAETPIVARRSIGARSQRVLYWGLAALFGVHAIVALVSRLTVDSQSLLGAVFGGPDPLVSNTLAKYTTLTALFWLLARRERMRSFFEPVFVIAFGITIAGTAGYALQGAVPIVTRVGVPIEVAGYATVVLLLDGLALLVVLAVRRIRYQQDYQVTALLPSEAECVMALHRAFRESSQNPHLTDRALCRRIDEHLVGIKGRLRGFLSAPFWLFENVLPALSGLRPPLSTMSREETRWMLRKSVIRPVWERSRALIVPLAEAAFQAGQTLHGLVTLAYFSSRDGQTEVGYVLPNARRRLQARVADERPPGSEPPDYPSAVDDDVGLEPSAPAEAARSLAKHIARPRHCGDLPDAVDYCVIGSGAGGAVAASRLAEQVGSERSILVLDRGGFYSPLEDFNDDELAMIRTLYTEGGLQTTRNFNFTILQAECVGGTTVINNAICFRLPDSARQEWAEYGIDTSELEPHYDRIAKELLIEPFTDQMVNERVEERFTRGVAGYNEAYAEKKDGWGKLSDAKRLEGNFYQCLGCGLCNIGCRRLRKLSMLETYLPWSLSAGARILPETGAVEIAWDVAKGKRRARSVVVRRRDGTIRSIKVNRAIVVSAGAIASSRLLFRSGLGGAHVGHNLACNYAFAPLVEFDDELDAFDGLQIALFAAPDSYESIFETTYNPPGSHSLLAALHFDKHAEFMAAYRRATNFAFLVGSEPVGSIQRDRDFVFGQAVNWSASQRDLEHIVRAHLTVARIAKAAGARRITLPTLPSAILEPQAKDFDQKLGRLASVLTHPRFFNLATAHPQGGNRMAADTDDRVVDLDGRVRGTSNVYVADASMFPVGCRVNPQWTIMAMASRTAAKVLEEQE